MAQQPYFSSYQNTELSLNPGYTGIDNVMGFNVTHRTQRYNSGLRLNTTNLQFQYTLANKERTKRLGGIGLIAESDQVSEGLPYSYYSIKLNGAYNLMLNSTQGISVGAQFSYNQQSIDASSFTTGNQWVNNQGYDESLAIGESFENQQANYLSTGFGAVWFKNTNGGDRLFYAGLSAFNLNQPTYTYTGNEQQLPLVYSFLGGASIFQFSESRIYMDGLASVQNEQAFWSVGPRLRRSFKNDDPFDPFTSGYIDVFTRYFSGDRLSFGTQVAQDNFSVGFTVDLHLNNAAQTASTEFSLSVFKRIKIGRKQAIDTTSSDYMIGESRQFEEDQIFSKEPVTVIEKEYQNKVTDDFSFELRKNFNYGFNETKLNEEAKAYLDDLAVLLNANKALQLKVSGHTDNIGTVEANQTISEERAKAVVDYLMEIGIEEDRLSYEGKGATVPLYKNNTEENRAKNRRVEFLIYAEKE
ncbi:hypothetical protein GCM10027429_21340 [Marivirga atlantica]